MPYENYIKVLKEEIDLHTLSNRALEAMLKIEQALHDYDSLLYDIKGYNKQQEEAMKDQY
jgi:hypothetical protein